MTNSSPHRSPRSATARWQEQVKPFKQPITWKSVWQLVTTSVAFVALWTAMVWSLNVSYWLTLLLALPAGGLTVRFFIISHDCGHGSFFRSRRANDIVGFWTSLLAYTPYRQWRYGHALHHASSGQIEERGVGYFWIMTREEYEGASKMTRLWYRFYRHPAVLLAIGGLYAFLFEYRLSFRSNNARQRRGVWATNLVLASLAIGLSLLVGWKTLLLVQLPICAVAATLGLALFYVQHHYEGSYWAHKEEWSYEKAALEGSSYIQLPRVLEYFVGSINYHHIHHLVPRIPNYRLREAHEAIETFRNIKPLTGQQILGAWKLRLIDETTGEWMGYPAPATAPSAATLTEPVPTEELAAQPSA